MPDEERHPGKKRGQKYSARPYVNKSSKRLCHDCGKPTTNYRCSACWSKIHYRDRLTDEDISFISNLCEAYAVNERFMKNAMCNYY